MIFTVLAICAPEPSLAESRDDNCLSCHTPNELLPAGIPIQEEVSDRLKWPACPGMTRILRAVDLTESGLTELGVLVHRRGSRDGPEDRALMEAETRYRRLRETPIVVQSGFAEETEELRRQLNARVLKPLDHQAKKRRLLISIGAGAGLGAMLVVLLWLIFAGRSLKKRAGLEPK